MSENNRRLEKGKVRDPEWASFVAEKIIAHEPNKNLYTCAAGISASGVIHFGNFRDVMTAYMVKKALEEKGKKARLLLSWDNFDRYRKVPADISDSFEEHIGKPLSELPDPLEQGVPYIERYQSDFIKAMGILGIEIDYRSQTDMYKSGAYDDEIIFALQNREKIADVLLSFMTEKAMTAKQIDPAVYKEEFYPISVYSSFTGKDATKVLSYDGKESITYLCKITKQEETINIRKKHIVKLNWKVDWPMRWKHESVDFEPGGIDHASQGSSYDVGTVLSKEIFNYVEPFFVGYTFVGIQGLGSKMSGSKGNAVSPLDLLDIYEPEILLWLYERKAPNQSFELAFNTELYRQYDEYDVENPDQNNISLRQAVAIGQIVQWNVDKFMTVLEQMDLEASKESVKRRLPLAQNWLEKYNQDEMISFNDVVNTDYVSEMTDTQKEQVSQFRKEFLELQNPTITELEFLSYKIPKDRGYPEDELKREQRQFFKDIYNLLISRNKGPRLGTFLWASDRGVIDKLLDI